MTVQELATYIKEHKNGRVPYPYDDNFIVAAHTRNVLYEHVHITDAHIFECCARASNYDEYIDLCRPLAKADTEAYLRERSKPAPKGRTKRRFR